MSWGERSCVHYCAPCPHNPTIKTCHIRYPYYESNGTPPDSCPATGMPTDIAVVQRVANQFRDLGIEAATARISLEKFILTGPKWAYEKEIPKPVKPGVCLMSAQRRKELRKKRKKKK